MELEYCGVVGQGPVLDEDGAAYVLDLDPAIKSLSQKLPTRTVTVGGYVHAGNNGRLIRNPAAAPPSGGYGLVGLTTTCPLTMTIGSTTTAGLIDHVVVLGDDTTSGNPDNGGWHPSAESFLADWNRGAAEVAGNIAGTDYIAAQISPSSNLLIVQAVFGTARDYSVYWPWGGSPGERDATTDRTAVRAAARMPEAWVPIRTESRVYLTADDYGLVPAVPTGLTSGVEALWALRLKSDFEGAPRDAYYHAAITAKTSASPQYYLTVRALPRYLGSTAVETTAVVETTEAAPETTEAALGSIVDVLAAKGNFTTLLGADNKAGVAEIMDAAEFLVRNPQVRHGTIKILFTTDEEIGRGADKVDLAKLGARFAYTLDGSTVGEIENETFSADGVTIEITGVAMHPGYAKGKMENAIKAASDIVARLPRDIAPETTDGREGFIHPVDMSGSMEAAKLQLIVRDFTEAGLKEKEELLQQITEEVMATYPGSGHSFTVKHQYRNMKGVLDRHPEIMDNLEEAVRRVGLEPVRHSIRGGTDGSRLSFMGLPCPNIYTGGHAYHSPLEWVSVQDMEKSVETIVALVKVWEERAA